MNDCPRFSHMSVKRWNEDAQRFEWSCYCSHYLECVISECAETCDYFRNVLNCEHFAEAMAGDRSACGACQFLSDCESAVKRGKRE